MSPTRMTGGERKFHLFSNSSCPEPRSKRTEEMGQVILNLVALFAAKIYFYTFFLDEDLGRGISVYVFTIRSSS